MQKKILVPLESEVRDLKSVHYALAAAGRLKASVIILRFPDSHEERSAWLEEALADLTVSARLAGLKLTVELGGEPVEQEVVEVAEHERVDLLVLSENQHKLKRGILKLAPGLRRTIILVKEKDDMNIDAEQGGSRWRS